MMRMQKYAVRGCRGIENLTYREMPIDTRRRRRIHARM